MKALLLAIMLLLSNEAVASTVLVCSQDGRCDLVIIVD